MSFTASLEEIVRENHNRLLSVHPNWTRVRLGDVASILNGFAFPSSGFTTTDGMPLIRIRDILKNETETYFTGEYEETYRVQPGEFIVGMDGDFNSTIWSGRPALLNQRVCKISPDERFYNRLFLAYALPGYLSAINAHTSAVTVKHLSSGTVADIPLPLPSLDEQQRIVAKIEELFSDLDAGVKALKRAKANLKRYRAAVLKAAVEGKLTEEWRTQHPDTEPASELLKRILVERRRRWEEEQLAKYEANGKQPPNGWKDKYKEPIEPDVSKLAQLPPSWCWTSIGQCFRVAVGATPSRKEASYWNGSIPWVSSGEVQFCRISGTKESITEDGLDNSSTQLNPAGSVMLGMIGEGKTRGQAAILDIEAANNQNCAAIWVSKTSVIPEFVYHWLYSQYEVTRRRGSGNNQPALNKTRVENIPFPLPPLEEQATIVEELELRLSVVDQTESNSVVVLRRAKRLRQSVLKKAFEGKLVPQDPNDEPAEKLLARIAADRKAVLEVNGSAKTKRPRKKKVAKKK